MTTTRATRPAPPRATGRPGRPSRGVGRYRPSGRALAYAGGVLAVIVAMLVVVFATPLLAVRDVEVSGARGVTGAAVLEVADVPDGVPLARLDTDAIAARLATLPQLASVEVQRSWPSTVRVVVVERTPLALVDVDGTRWLIDAEGVLYAQVTEPPAGLPVLEVATPGPGDTATLGALGVLQVLPADILARVGRIVATSADGVQLRLVGGRTVVWGSAADSARKAEVLAAVFDQPGGLIDVSAPDAVVIR